MASRKPRLNVLQIASSLFEWGGIERYVHYLDLGLSERGHSVTVVCPPKTPLANSSKHPECLFANRAKYSLRTYIGFRRIGKAIRPDIAHIHFSPDFVMPALALKQTSRAKLVMTRHLVLPWSQSKVKKITQIFDHIIPVSDAVQVALLASGVPDSMMTVAKAGVPDPGIKTVPSSSRQSFSVGCFGRLVREKGVEVLLRAVAMTPGVDCEIYGEGPQLADLKTLAGSLGILERTQFHGFVPDVARAMSEVDLVMVPSMWDEAFPYSILEAMALGRAVVASRAGGIPEVVGDGQTGRLFTRGDFAELSQVLTELRDNPAILVKMGKCARLLQRAEYTIPKMAERIEAVYKTVLDPQ